MNIKTFFIASMFVLAGCTFWIWFNQSPNITPIYPTFVPNTPTARFVPSCINVINKSNKIIESIYSTINVRLDERSIRLSGIIAYNKSKQFRMQINSFAGKEIDIGSNDHIFWLYSKRMSPPYLYYSRYEDMINTRLKPLFHPLWVIESLGLSDVSGTDFQKMGNYIASVEQDADFIGQKIIKMTLIDPNKPAIIGHYLYDQNNNLIASSEVESFYRFGEAFIPKKIRLVWQQEKKSLTIDIENPSINKPLSVSLWQMPKTKKMLDMGREPH